MQTNVDITEVLVLKLLLYQRLAFDVAIPYEAFNVMKKSGFVKNAMDRFVSINEIRLENFVQEWRSCFNNTLVCMYYFVTMYYVKITMQGIRKYSTIKDPSSVLHCLFKFQCFLFTEKAIRAFTYIENGWKITLIQPQEM